MYVGNTGAAWYKNTRVTAPALKMGEKIVLSIKLNRFNHNP